MARFKKIIFKVVYLSFALVFIIYSLRIWYLYLLLFLSYSKNMVSNRELIHEMNKALESNSEPIAYIDNSIPSNERLEYFKYNIPIISDYYFGDIRSYDKSIFIQDKEIFGKVESVDLDKQELKVLIPDVMNLKTASEERVISFSCPLSDTYVFFGENVTYEDSFLLEDGSLNIQKIVKPGVVIAVSLGDSIFYDKYDWCIVY